MDRLATLRNFCAPHAPALKPVLDNVAAHLARGPLSGTMAVVVSGEERRRILLLDLSRPEAEEAPEGKAVFEAPEFLVYVRRETLMEILRGELSPVAALLQGRLRYSGDETLGLAIFRELAATPDATFEPCRQPGDG